MLAAVLFALSLSGLSHAQNEGSRLQPASNKNIFKTQARAVDASSLMAGNRKVINLWGIEAIELSDPVLKIKARTELDNKIGSAPVVCEWRNTSPTKNYAQCVNSDEEDLSLFMIQNGFAIADRTTIYDTVFEDAYTQAENQAKAQGRGVWASGGHALSSSLLGDSIWVFSLGAGIFAIFIGAFTYLSIKIMRGFQQVIDAQNDNVQMMSRERKLRDKERSIVAVMLDSELKANKAKIEAYIVVYEEMLRGLTDPIKTPKYKKTGDIIQRQPALDRSVFDLNTDKVDILGRRLASELIHFYARIKTNPEYTNIEPDTDLNDVIKMVEESLDGARRLNKIADQLVESFSSVGLSSEVPNLS